MEKSLNKTVIFDIDYTLFDTALFKETGLKKFSLYKEIIDVLKKISKIARLIIFSEGEINFQKKKLKKTGILDFFEEVHIFAFKEDHLQNVLVRYNKTKIFLVDDKLKILKKAKEKFASLITIWIKRGYYAKNQKEIKGFTPDYIVEDLSEIIGIIKK